MGRSEVWGGETCFSRKTWASASLAYSTFAFPTSNQAMELKKKTRKKFFFLKNFWFLKISKKKFRIFFNFFLRKLESVNHWLKCIKISDSYSSNSSRYGRVKNCTKNDVFCPKLGAGLPDINDTPKRHIYGLTSTLGKNMKAQLQAVLELRA